MTSGVLVYLASTVDKTYYRMKFAFMFFFLPSRLLSNEGQEKNMNENLQCVNAFLLAPIVNYSATAGCTTLLTSTNFG